MNDLVQRALVTVLSVSLMASIGLRVDVPSVRRAIGDVRFVVKTVVFNFVVFPLLAWGAATAFGLPRAVATGVLLCALGAGGSNGLIFIGKVGGDLAYGFLSLVVTGVLSALALPWFVASAVTGAAASGSAYGAVAFASLRAIVLLQVAPAIVGYAARRPLGARAPRVAHVLAKLAEGLLWIMTALFVALRWRSFATLGGAAVAAIAVVIVAGLGASRLFYAPGSGVGKAFLFSGLVRNIVVALLLNEWIVQAEGTKLAILCYCLFMLVAGAAATLPYRATRAAAEQPRSLPLVGEPGDA